LCARAGRSEGRSFRRPWQIRQRPARTMRHGLNGPRIGSTAGRRRSLRRAHVKQRSMTFGAGRSSGSRQNAPASPGLGGRCGRSPSCGTPAYPRALCALLWHHPQWPYLRPLGGAIGRWLHESRYGNWSMTPSNGRAPCGPPRRRTARQTGFTETGTVLLRVRGAVRIPLPSPGQGCEPCGTRRARRGAPGTRSCYRPSPVTGILPGPRERACDGGVADLRSPGGGRSRHVCTSMMLRNYERVTNRSDPRPRAVRAYAAEHGRGDGVLATQQPAPWPPTGGRSPQPGR
jgi:hypothetical protein